ncbi:MAG: hypothetical protein HUU49_05075 [Candidatus Buchananbacteria bacterium]|nr:hypothetical protein [Candidatus Buchananbacteria bacterium]
MKIRWQKSALTFLGLALVLGNFLLTTPVRAELQLVRSADFGTIYYIDSRGVRHPFPNEITYRSWYGADFSKVVTVGNEFLANYPLGENITIRPGTYLVKIRTTSPVYAVEQGGVLREIQNESIAESIYGADWSKRVVDVPDVFFENYQIGQPIKHDYTIPESVLYFNSDLKKYFYKNAGLLRAFADDEALAKNYFDKSFAISANRTFYEREKPIQGFDKNVFDPIALPIADRRDCENKKLKAAVILLADEEYSSDEVAKVQLIKNAASERYHWATDGFGEIDFDYPTTILLDDGYLIRKRNDGTTEVRNEAINTFYDNNPDEFDFIFVWTNFKIPTEDTNEIAHFVPVTNKWEGINKGSLDRSSIFGSQGKLKGVVMMGNINKYNPGTTEGLDAALNVVLHEILHQWSAYINFDDDGKNNNALLRNDDFFHWSIYAGFISPLGGSGWIDNGDGTFTSGLTKLANTNRRAYSQLDLYLMGLVDKRYVTPIMYLEPLIKDEVANTIKATPQYVTIDQIIKANGPVKCSID